MKVFKRTLNITVFKLATLDTTNNTFTVTREIEMPPYESRGRFERELKKTLTDEKIIDIYKKEVIRQVSLQKFWEMSEEVEEVGDNE